MNNLIKIETKENGQRLVSARELYNKLEVTERFANWFERYVIKYEFVENQDFTSVKSFTLVNNGAERELQDYALTLDVAKHVCMLQRSELGMKFRQYFIECEKKLNTPVVMTEKDKVLLEMDIVERTSKILNLNDNSKLLCLHNVLENHNIPTNILPQYTESKGQLLPATELLKRNNVNISAIKFNKLMLEHGIIEEKTRPSSKGIKKYKNLTNTYYGENQVSPKNPKETQILYYEHKFNELLHKLNLG